MRPMRPLLCLALLSLGLLSACALRPYYRQVLPPEQAGMKPQGLEGRQQVSLRLVSPGTEQPIPGARVLLSTSRGRVSMTSDANGLVQMPLTSALLAENPLVEVVLPPGTSGYVFQPVQVEPETQPASEPAPQQ